MLEEEKNNSIIRAKGVEFPRPLEAENLQQKTSLRLFNDFQVFERSYTVPYQDATNANYYPVIYVATIQCFLVEAKLRHEANSTSGVVDVEKLTSGVARGSGSSMIASTFSIASGAKTIQSRGPSNTLANSQLAPGNAVALKATGTLTNAEHVTVTLLFGVNSKDLPLSANI